MRNVYVLGVAAHPWGKWPDKSQLQLAVETLGAALDDAGVNWRDLQGLVAASSRFEGGMGWGLHANEVLQAVGENGAAAVNVGGGCAAGGIAVHLDDPLELVALAAVELGDPLARNVGAQLRGGQVVERLEAADAGLGAPLPQQLGVPGRSRPQGDGRRGGPLGEHAPIVAGA